MAGLNTGASNLLLFPPDAKAAMVNGGIVTWGHQGGDSSGVQAELKTGVDTIYSTSRASCAKLVNGGIA